MIETATRTPAREYAMMEIRSQAVASIRIPLC
jgi:hypothetical protein